MSRLRKLSVFEGAIQTSKKVCQYGLKFSILYYGWIIKKYQNGKVCTHTFEVDLNLVQ